ncbi:tyrosine-protein phosphatase [Caulobacter sp. KR2-114]|uniref:tyrosine-protein phosphatase n=1 Tax=Caulobacter sp. KR2-114 TaxID=3400912 RepID=UPI003C03AFF2
MQRHIDFEGIENFRDFGGYAGAGGRALKAGRLYRSGYHAHATDADLARLRDLGVTAIVDLRRPEERRREPARRWPGFDAQVVENDMVSEHHDWLDVLRGLDEVTPAWFYEDSLAMYRLSPFEARHIDLFRRYFRILADGEGPLVVHCAAGKDRTGLICALTHHLAGVAHDDMIADYLLTNDEARIERKMGFLGGWMRDQAGVRASPEALRMAVSVHPDYLQASFKVITDRSGSVDAYLADVLGVDEAMREAICERLLG